MSSSVHAGRHRRPGRHRAPFRPGSLVNPISMSVASLTAATFLVNAAFSPSAAARPGDVAMPQTTSAMALAAQFPGALLGEAEERQEQAEAAREAAEDAYERRERARQERARAAAAAARAKAAERAAKKAAARRAALAQARSWVMPLKNPRLTSGFGHRWGRLHAGLDFGAPIGTPLYAMSSGTVTFAGSQSGYGTKVEIRYWDGTVSYYGHMSDIDVEVGQKVTPGQRVGESGNTGRSTGPHLHLEVHPGGDGAVDPKPWLAKRGLG